MAQSHQSHTYSIVVNDGDGRKGLRKALERMEMSDNAEIEVTVRDSSPLLPEPEPNAVEETNEPQTVDKPDTIDEPKPLDEPEPEPEPETPETPDTPRFDSETHYARILKTMDKSDSFLPSTKIFNNVPKDKRPNRGTFNSYLYQLSDQGFVDKKDAKNHQSARKVYKISGRGRKEVEAY